MVCCSCPDNRAEERLLKAGERKAFQTRTEAKAALDDTAERKDRNRGGKTDYPQGPGWNRKYRCEPESQGKKDTDQDHQTPASSKQEVPAPQHSIWQHFSHESGIKQSLNL